MHLRIIILGTHVLCVFAVIGCVVAIVGVGIAILCTVFLIIILAMLVLRKCSSRSDVPKSLEAPTEPMASEVKVIGDSTAKYKVEASLSCALAGKRNDLLQEVEIGKQVILVAFCDCE